MNKLSTPSRIVLAIAALSLIATYFFPIWRIDLFAPQYPEGLVMFIWWDNITGQVDIINGLNRYIGMKPIKVEMFPEFSFLVYVVAFYILLGLLVALIGNRKILFWYLIFTAFGGALALYDYYLWGYDYGHNLDPAAAIKIPGLSYQPPLIGHARILNFDAYSFPDTGGWIIIIATVLALLVWIYEWRQNRRKIKGSIPVNALLIAAMLLVSCSTNPVPFQPGKDACDICKMTIMDTHFGGQVITKKGKMYKFDDVYCMISFLRSGSINKADIAQNVIIDFERPNEFLPVNDAFFLVSPNLKSPMSSNTAGFSSKQIAERAKDKFTGEIKLWEDLLTNSQ